MTEGQVVNRVHSASTHVFGRTLNSAGVHHFVIDGTTAPKEEITPVDAFISGISSCAVHQVERFAEELEYPLERAEADIVAIRNQATPQNFERIDLHISMVGPTRAQGAELVERFKGR